MDVAAIEAVINQHLFSHKGKCECGEYLGSDPESVAKHLARKIHEVMHEIEPKHYAEIREVLGIKTTSQLTPREIRRARFGGPRGGSPHLQRSDDE